jgi:uncharacterized repeat protein (TIGR03803 family)
MKKNILIAFIIFNCLICNAQYIRLFEFDSINGSHPGHDLIFDGTFLYGMTSAGGANNDGVVFKVKPDGTDYLKLLDFAGATNGRDPHGSLIFDGTFLYGMTTFGGTSDEGTIFKIKPDGTSYSKLFDFVGNGYEPYGSLITDGVFLYGMTNYGGVHNDGIVFKIKLDGTGFVNLLNFAGINGKNTNGSLVFDGTFLYGMTYYGGIYNDGIIFKIKPDGTGYLKLLDFAGSINGSTPWRTLIFDGSYMYGMTAAGGQNNFGTIFKIKPDGTSYVKLFDFDSINGRYPNGSLFFDGSFLYGMAGAGLYNLGTIFKIKPDGTAFFKLLDFDGLTNGTASNGSFISDGNFLYAVQGGGVNHFGQIFKYGLNTGVGENNFSPIISIYPNPTTGMFTVFSSSLQQSQIEIYNILGKIIYKSTITDSKSEIDLTKESKGIYFVKLMQDNEMVKTEKLVIAE